VVAGTSNVGVIQGGEATNVITPEVNVRAEARSHDPAFREKIVKAIEGAFQKAARSVKNVDGKCGAVEIEGRLDYESFRLPDDSPAVLAAEEAIRSLGGNPGRAISNGGLDANWLTARGIPTVTLGCGQENRTRRRAVGLRRVSQGLRDRLAAGHGVNYPVVLHKVFPYTPRPALSDSGICSLHRLTSFQPPWPDADHSAKMSIVRLHSAGTWFLALLKEENGSQDSQPQGITRRGRLGRTR